MAALSQSVSATSAAALSSARPLTEKAPQMATRAATQAQEALPWLSEPLFHIKGLALTPLSLITFLAILAGGLFLSLLLRRVLRAVLQRAQMQQGPAHSLLKLTHYLIVVLTFYTALVSTGVNLTAFHAIGGALMVGIGFGMQNIVQNFISGLILLIERPAAVGDIIRLGTLEGRVKEVHTRCTVVNTRDNLDVIVPNSDLLTGQLINLTYLGNHDTCHNLKINVAFSANPQQVRDTLLVVAQAHEKVLAKPPPQVLFEEFGESAFVFRLGVWVSDQWTWPLVLSELRFAIESAFRQQGIDIPYPQRVVYSVPGLPGGGAEAKSGVEE